MRTKLDLRVQIGVSTLFALNMTILFVQEKDLIVEDIDTLQQMKRKLT